MHEYVTVRFKLSKRNTVNDLLKSSQKQIHKIICTMQLVGS